MLLRTKCCQVLILGGEGIEPSWTKDLHQLRLLLPYFELQRSLLVKRGGFTSIKFFNFLLYNFFCSVVDKWFCFINFNFRSKKYLLKNLWSHKYRPLIIFKYYSSWNIYFKKNIYNFLVFLFQKSYNILLNIISL